MFLLEVRKARKKYRESFVENAKCQFHNLTSTWVRKKGVVGRHA